MFLQLEKLQQLPFAAQDTKFSIATNCALGKVVSENKPVILEGDVIFQRCVRVHGHIYTCVCMPVHMYA